MQSYVILWKMYSQMIKMILKIYYIVYWKGNEKFVNKKKKTISFNISSAEIIIILLVYQNRSNSYKITRVNYYKIIYTINTCIISCPWITYILHVTVETFTQ